MKPPCYFSPEIKELPKVKEEQLICPTSLNKSHAIIRTMNNTKCIEDNFMAIGFKENKKDYRRTKR